MKKKTLLALFFLSTLYVSAQEVISSQGETYTTSSGTIDFTIGEVVINTETDGNNTITQGFHQTNWNFLSIENHAPNYEATVYPNPTSEVLNIKTSAFEGVSYLLIDGKGKVVLQGELTSELNSIQVEQLPMGKYSVVLENETQILKTINLIKMQ